MAPLQRRFATTMRANVATAIAALLWFAAPSVRADDERAVAGQLFQAGFAAYERGDFSAAGRAFTEADRRVPRGATMFDAGLAWQAAGEPARAADAYATAIASGELTRADATTAQRQLDGLEKSLVLVEVREPAGARVSVAHAVDVPIPARIHLAPGEYDVEAQDGAGRRGSTHVAFPADTAGGKIDVRIALTPVGGRAETPDLGNATAPNAAHRVVRRWGWITLAGGAALGVVAAVLGIEGLSARNAFVQSSDTDASAHDRAVTLRTLANVGWIAGVTAGATGVTLLLVPLRSPPRQDSRFDIETVGVTLTGTF